MAGDSISGEDVCDGVSDSVLDSIAGCNWILKASSAYGFSMGCAHVICFCCCGLEGYMVVSICRAPSLL